MQLPKEYKRPLQLPPNLRAVTGEEELYKYDDRADTSLRGEQRESSYVISIRPPMERAETPEILFQEYFNKKENSEAKIIKEIKAIILEEYPGTRVLAEQDQSDEEHYVIFIINNIPPEYSSKTIAQKTWRILERVGQKIVNLPFKICIEEER